MDKVWIGIDNGVTGSVGIIKPNGEYLYVPTPVKKCLKYTKEKQNITRVVGIDLLRLLREHIGNNNAFIALERPMVNPTRFKASSSALRCHEATLIILEQLGLSYEFFDSKIWQKEMLPKIVMPRIVIPKEATLIEKSKLKSQRKIQNTNIKKQTKISSCEVGKRLFPKVSEMINKQGDADGILMAEYCRRKGL